ncbi:MAG TPA: hypothetical protein VK453_14325 [Micromonosporaceae bacterium]|nr:hypothetical protein [Micromonosporaceae bacterium]
MNDLVVEALFVSDLQPSQDCSGEMLHEAVTRAILRYGSDGCAAGVAEEFGHHPDTAVGRMCWARRTLDRWYPVATSYPGGESIVDNGEVRLVEGGAAQTSPVSR